MDIVQSFYDNLAGEYDKLFENWDDALVEQGAILDRLFKENGYSKEHSILDCACGIGTQAIALAKLGYKVTASDISTCEIDEAKKRALKHNVSISFKNADFRYLGDVFSDKFDIIIAMDNALPHMLTTMDMERTIESITKQLAAGGMLVASIRDYDALIKDKPQYSPPYIHKTEDGQRVAFQSWEWNKDCYRLVQYIIEDGKKLTASRFECEYRAVLRNELTELLEKYGCDVVWKHPDETHFYQPVVIAKKRANV